MNELYCFTLNLSYDYNPEYSFQRPSYKIEANYQPLEVICNETLRFIKDYEISRYYSSDFKLDVYNRKSQEDFVLSIEPHPKHNNILIINVYTDLREEWNNKEWNRWKPIVKLIQKYENLGYNIDEGDLENRNFKIDIYEDLLLNSPDLIKLGINNFTKLYPDIRPYKIELFFDSFLLSLQTTSESLNETHLIKVLEQSIKLSEHIKKYKDFIELLREPKHLSQEIETAYLKSNFDKFVQEFKRDYDIYIPSYNFGNVLIEYVDNQIFVKLPYFTTKNIDSYVCEDDYYNLKIFRIECIDDIKSFFIYLLRLGALSTNKHTTVFNTFILILHTKFSSGIWPSDKLKKEILNSYYEAIPESERWKKGILRDEIRNILNRTLKEVKVKKENYNYVKTKSCEIYYDGNDLLTKQGNCSEKWVLLDIKSTKNSLDLYDLVYLELMSKYGVCLSRFLLIRLIEKVSTQNKQSSYDLLMEYEAILSVRETTEKHEEIISNWESEYYSDNYIDDNNNEFFTNEDIRKSYNEYFGHPDAEGWIDTSEY